MPRSKSFRSRLYRGACDLGNLEAAAKGPTAYGKRVALRSVYRKTNRGLGKLLGRIGLQ